LAITLLLFHKVSSQNLIMVPKGQVGCLSGNSTFTGSWGRKCNSSTDQSNFPYPWCTLSNIEYIGNCNNGVIDSYYFEFSFDKTFPVIDNPYIQGQLCHKLLKNCKYTFEFKVENLNDNALKKAYIYVNFSDSILSTFEIMGKWKILKPNSNSIHSIVSNKSGIYKEEFVSNGNERFFQLWIVFPKKTNNHFFIKNYSLTSAIDTTCNIENNSSQDSTKFYTYKPDTVSINNKILFEFDKYQLKTEGISTLKKLIDSISSNKSIKKITIIGHSDTFGNSVYNHQLSLSRANVIRDFLSQKILDAEWEIIAEGESKPLYFDMEKQYLNRRVELIITYLH
jgi:outer membrane protein OmpA-like peptidoglycan-associated protein